MNRSVAFELFGEMRHPTFEEQQAYREMLKKHSTIIEGINIFEMDKEPTIIEGINIFEMDKEPYNIRYVANLGFVDIPQWLQEANNNGEIICNHPEIVQDIWDLSYDYEGVPTLTVVKTGKEFRMGGAPITYKDVYGD